MNDRKNILSFAVVLLCYILSFFHRFAPAGIAGDLASAFNTSAASLGTLAATYFYVYTVMQIPTGMLADSFGPRRILTAGCLIAALGSAIFALAPTLNWALVGRTLVGLGVSVTFISMLKLIALNFEERRFATLTGVSLLVGNAGSILAGTPLTLLAQTFSWRSVFIGVAIFSVMLAVLAWQMLHDHHTHQHPQQRPLARHKHEQQAHAPIQERPRIDLYRSLIAVLRNPKTWPPAIVNFGVAGSFFAFGGLWASPYFVQVQGLSRTVASHHLSVYFGAFAIGACLIGTFSDKLERRRPVLLACACLVSICWLIWLQAHRIAPPLSYALIGAMGFFTSCFTLTWACAKEVNPPHLAGTSTSVVNMGGFLAAALLQPTVGAIMDAHWDGALAQGVRQYSRQAFQIGLMPFLSVNLLALAAGFCVTETRCRNICQKYSG